MVTRKGKTDDESSSWRIRTDAARSRKRADAPRSRARADKQGGYAGGTPADQVRPPRRVRSGSVGAPKS